MNDALKTFVNELAKWAIPLIIAAALGYIQQKIAPAVVEFYKTRTSADQRNLIALIFDAVVDAAEVARLKAELAGVAFDTLTYARETAKKQLAASGITWLDLEYIDALLRSTLKAKLEFEGVLSTSTAVTKDLRPGLAARLWV